MTIKITWLGHACTLIETPQVRLLVDPFLTSNPMAAVTADTVQADVIAITHGHGDHVGDTVAIARRTGALVIANYEITEWLKAQGVEKVHPQHIGGGFDYPWGRLKLTIAHHGSGLPDGSYGGSPAGLLISVETNKIYHAGDTGLFYDMKLIGEEGVDLAILPIGDNFTMGPVDALRAVHLIRPRRVFPIHWNTFEVIQQDPQAWVEWVNEIPGCEGIVLQPGGSIEL
jgi:L-ascorbate metabolism protein UlaG (beta-lactamase superfamily)